MPKKHTNSVRPPVVTVYSRQVKYSCPDPKALKPHEMSYVELKQSGFEIDAKGDFDKDGDLDLASGGKLWRNRGNSNKWLAVQLKGTGKVNSAAIGATVQLQIGNQTLTRHVNSSTGEGSQNSLTLHFGLGPNPPKDLEVTILWPAGTNDRKSHV